MDSNIAQFCFVLNKVAQIKQVQNIFECMSHKDRNAENKRSITAHINTDEGKCRHIDLFIK